MAFEQLHLPPTSASATTTGSLPSVTGMSRANRYREQLGLSESQIYQDWRPMVARDDVDVIDIMVPIELNFAITQAVAHAVSGTGKGIICEKPLGANLREAAAARELPAKFKVPIMIAENRRYSPETNIIRDMVQSGRVGDVVYFTYSRTTDFPSQMMRDDFAAREWRQHPDYRAAPSPTARCTTSPPCATSSAPSLAFTPSANHRSPLLAIAPSW